MSAPEVSGPPKEWAIGGFDIQSYDEHDRITLEHYILKMGFKGNYIAPIKDVLSKNDVKVLDVGCGPGMWAMEMGTEFPHANFKGIEFYDCFPDNVYPSNVTFDAVEDPTALPFEDNTFDYVYQRMRGSAYLQTDWPKVINELVRVAKPGAWIELVESDMEISNPGEATKYLAENAIRVARESGYHTTVSKELGNLLRDAGAVNVSEKAVNVEAGKWGGHIGDLFKEDMHRVFTAVKPDIGSISSEEYEAKMKKTLQEVEENKSFSTFRAAYGQKP